MLDAFDSSCCSYVHKKYKKQPKKKKREKIFQKKKRKKEGVFKKKIFWTKGIGPSNHFNSLDWEHWAFLVTFF